VAEVFEDHVPVIYFLGIAPGRCYQAMLPTFISGWKRQDIDGAHHIQSARPGRA
jgi:hypothetical protein